MSQHVRSTNGAAEHHLPATTDHDNGDTMKHLKRALTLAAVAVAVGTPTVVGVTSAHAASRDGKCDSGEFCYYYNSGQQGSVSDFTASVGDYGTKQPSCYEFRGAGAGKGRCIKNDAASVWNRTSKTVRVYYNSDYSGASQDFEPGAKGNLNATLKNENASHKIGPTSVSNTNLSYALYKKSGGRITCGYDGYTNTPGGAHEGIDFARSIGSPVRALVGGEVVNVVRGANGRAGLSTIAVYSRKYDKTVVYLHAAPLSSLSKGDLVDRDDQIGTEAWRGVSSSSAAHTHVEVRDGRRTLAAISVTNTTLENPNPAPFWKARGYTVK